jgi:hypothetical protein
VNWYIEISGCLILHLVMENDRQENRGGTGAILCGAAFVLVPLLYVLSFGPARPSFMLGHAP